MRSETLEDGHEWLRVADRRWNDPLDPTYAQRAGGRWNPPSSFPTLYLNEDLNTARINFVWFAARWPYEPEDLRNDNAPVLVGATLPRRQSVADVHTAAGVAAAGMPPSYPLDGSGSPIGHGACQPIGVRAKDIGLRGIHCRSVNAPAGAGRELAWFPATSRSRAHHVATVNFEDWFWA